MANFIERFNKVYNKIPPNCKPPVAFSKVRFSKVFDDDFAILPREITFVTLVDMQTNSLEVEPNRSASAKLKTKVEKTERKMKAREEGGSSSKRKTEDHKIDEITSLLRNTSNRISKIEAQPGIVQQVSNRP